MIRMRRHTRPGRTWQVATIAIALAWMFPMIAQAHISIWPRESSPGATEKYVVRIPSEGKVATTSVDLEVPEGVVVETMQSPAGFKYTVKRNGDTISAITWQVNVPPGEFIEVAFVARNPRG